MKSNDKMGKPTKMQDFEVWFDDNGNLAQYSYAPYRQQGKKERNSVFQDVLEYVGYFSARGGNSHIQMRSVNSGRIFHMFMIDFHEALFMKRFIDNRITGLFTFCKKGNSQGLKIFFEAP